LRYQKSDKVFDNENPQEFNSGRGVGETGGIFGLFFSLLSLGFTIAFKIIGAFLNVFSSILLGERVPKRYEKRQPQNNQQEKKEARAESTVAKKESSNAVKMEQVKKTFNQKEEEHTSDWNLVLFVLMLIPLIITLAIKRLDLAGLTFAGGTALIIVYNIIRGAVIRAKKRKQERVEEVKPISPDIEKLIKEAFNKVYAIRRELHKVPKQRKSLERLEQILKHLTQLNVSSTITLMPLLRCLRSM
jgi:membrane protein implicated in regulation of membrane protease activity